MSTEITVDLSQNVENNLSAIAEMERAKLIPKNDYNAAGNEYSSVNKDAVADGDNKDQILLLLIFSLSWFRIELSEIDIKF
jgi:hypothetical protein